MQEWLFYNGAKKNYMRKLWNSSMEFLRSSDAEISGFVLRPETDFPGSGNQTCFLQKVREGEARDVGLAFGEFSSYKPLCLFCGSEMPIDDDCRCSQGVETGLENGQRVRQAIYARAAETNRDTGTTCDRDRRDLDSEGTDLSNSGERFNPQTCNLVWRRGSLGREHGFVLPGSGPKKDGQDRASGHGHVESFREVGQEERASCGDSLRQISRNSAFRKGVGHDTQAGVCEGVLKGSFFHQGAEIHPAITQREPDSGWQEVVEETLGSQQENSDSVFAEGDFWAAVGLQHGRVGSEVLRELEGFTEMAETQTLRQVCRDD